METHVTTGQDTVHALNSFLRGELAAVETYRQALDKVQEPSFRTILEECLLSHQDRVRTLTERIVGLGGEPAHSSGPWGVFAKMVEGSAKIFGDKAAIDALEDGEDHGLRDYQTDLDKLDAATRIWFESAIVPLQQRTHRAMSQLKHSIH